VVDISDIDKLVPPSGSSPSRHIIVSGDMVVVEDPVASVSSDTVEVPDLVVVEFDPGDTVDDPSVIILWDVPEHAWIHHSTDIWYSLEHDTFRMFVSIDIGDNKRLFYHVDGEGLLLITLGHLGEENRQVL